MMKNNFIINRNLIEPNGYFRIKFLMILIIDHYDYDTLYTVGLYRSISIFKGNPLFVQTTFSLILGRLSKQMTEW